MIIVPFERRSLLLVSLHAYLLFNCLLTSVPRNSTPEFDTRSGRPRVRQLTNRNLQYRNQGVSSFTLTGTLRISNGTRHWHLPATKLANANAPWKGGKKYIFKDLPVIHHVQSHVLVELNNPAPSPFRVEGLF